MRERLYALTAGLVVAASLAIACVVPAAARTVAPPTECGRPTTAPVCHAASGCEWVQVFDVPDAWHGLNQCLRKLRDVWQRHGETAPVNVKGEKVAVAQLVDRQITWEMSRSRVRIQDGNGNSVRFAGLEALDDGPQHLVALLNDLGQPYNSMGQSGFAYFMYQFAILADRSSAQETRRTAKRYRSLSRAVTNTVLTPAGKGGLSTTEACEDGQQLCTWYHSITRRDRPTVEGATLNQHLHVLRDLALMHDVAVSQGWPEHEKYRSAFSAGVRQLFTKKTRQSSRTPTLEDFLADETGAMSVRWAFYGYDTHKLRGYFLGSSGRDCHYHIHSLQLLNSILISAEKMDVLPPELVGPQPCGTPLHSLFRAVQVRVHHPDSRAWSSGSTGRDFSCPTLSDKQPPALEELRHLFRNCPGN